MARLTGSKALPRKARQGAGSRTRLPLGFMVAALTLAATIQTDPLPTIDKRTKEELCSLFVQSRRGIVMVRAVTEEALALASLTLFLAMVAVWAEVRGGL